MGYSPSFIIVLLVFFFFFSSRVSLSISFIMSDPQAGEAEKNVSKKKKKKKKLRRTPEGKIIGDP